VNLAICKKSNNNNKNNNKVMAIVIFPIVGFKNVFISIMLYSKNLNVQRI